VVDTTILSELGFKRPNRWPVGKHPTVEDVRNTLLLLTPEIRVRDRDRRRLTGQGYSPLKAAPEAVDDQPEHPSRACSEEYRL